MTFTIGYPIHNKGYMMDEIIDGLVYSIDQSKYDVKYKFIFDGCTDNTKESYEKEKNKLKNCEYIETDNLFQLRTNNLLMKDFDTDFLIIFQDDMVLKDTAFLDNILILHEKYGDQLGIVGCRDGFDAGYSNMSSAYFSESTVIVERLCSGEYREKMMVNIGPLVLTKNLVEKMGYFDEIYGNAAYEEMEYSLKCTLNGLKTIVMGVDLIHSKFDHKNKNMVAHTSADVLSVYHSANSKIFSDRWHHIAKI